MLKNLKKNYLLLLFIFLIFYFFFNLLSGERGLVSYFKKNEILEKLKGKELEIIKQIQEYELKNSLLSDNLDIDFIETLIREKLLFGKIDETTYIIKK